MAAATAILGQAAQVPNLGGAATYANKICIINDAAFRMYFNLQDLRTGQYSSDTSSYDIDKYKCMMIADAFPGNLNEGDYIFAYVHAQAGSTKSVDTPVLYSSTATTATYNCRGATLTYSCDLL